MVSVVACHVGDTGLNYVNRPFYYRSTYPVVSAAQIEADRGKVFISVQLQIENSAKRVIDRSMLNSGNR